MLNELFGINDEEKIEDMISFSKNLDIGLHVRIQKNKRSRKYIDISANTLKQIKEKFKLNYEKAIKSSKTIRFDKDNNKIKQIKI